MQHSLIKRRFRDNERRAEEGEHRLLIFVQGEPLKHVFQDRRPLPSSASTVDWHRSITSYLARTVAYCATHDIHCLGGLRFEPLTGAPKVVATHLLIATEIFILAHEYGHHIDEHQLGEFADVDGLAGDLPYAQELRADYLAALITAHFGAICTPRNPWAASAAVAIIGLGAMDLVFRTRRFLETGLDREHVSDTHPPMMVRMIGVERLNRRYNPRERAKMREMRKNMRRVMTGLWDVIKPELQQLWKRGIRSMPLAAKDAQWLP